MSNGGGPIIPPMASKTTVALLRCVALFAAGVAGCAMADTPSDLVARYRADAAKAQPSVEVSADAGRGFFLRQFNVSADFPSCSTCHTDNPAAVGKHAVTGKRIAPLAPAANAERFTEWAHVEKWFRRNCTEVVGRECSSGEKANFIAFLLTAKP